MDLAHWDAGVQGLLIQHLLIFANVAEGHLGRIELVAGLRVARFSRKFFGMFQRLNQCAG